jgi:hypothetical protein
MPVITLLITLACIAGFVGVCWILFVKLWPETPEPEEPFSWSESVFERKDK